MNRRLIINAGSGGMTSVAATDGSTYTFEGNFTYAVEDLDSYVQVKILWIDGGAVTPPPSGITYRDPSALLTVGAYVKVPYATGWGIGKVVALGRGSDLPTAAGQDVVSLITEQAL